MELYQEMYLTLFAATEDVLNMLDAKPLPFQEAALPGKIRARLIQAQQQCEDLYVENDAQKLVTARQSAD